MLNHGVRLAMTEQWQNWPGATEVRLVVCARRKSQDS
jgi:hypothetical protein